MQAALELRDEPSWILPSTGTDRINGPADAADAATLDRARAKGLAPHTFVSDNNDYRFFISDGRSIPPRPHRDERHGRQIGVGLHPRWPLTDGVTEKSPVAIDILPFIDMTARLSGLPDVW